MITKTYMIPEENVESLEKKFSAAARKIHKINPELEPTMEKSNHTIVLVRKVELRPCDYRSNATVKEVPYEARRVELEIPDDAVFAENNWAFGGSVEPSGVDGKNFVNVSLSGNIVPTRYFFSNPCACDYCKTNRKRNKTYLVVNQETGEWKQLGKECLKLFVTGIDVDAIATFESFIKEAEDAANPGDEFFYNGRFKFVKVADALALACAIYRERGYLATRDAVGDSNNLCNKNIVQRKLTQQYGYDSDFLNISSSVRSEIDEITIKTNTAIAKEDVEVAVEMVKRFPDEPYYNNLKVIVENEYIPLNKLGLLVSIPKAIDRYEEEKRRQEAKEKLAAESNYLGSVGEKISVNFVSGREVACCETQFGLLHIYEFKDANGNTIVWKSSSSKDIPESGTVAGTVKAHEEYDGIKQTVILRAKITL